MIKSWRLKNFKSFRDLPPLPLSYVNVIAGANSSGKSSFIQSILLLKQTVQYGSANRSLTLNGPLLRLGAFDDLRHVDALGEHLQIGMEFEFVDKELRGPGMTPWARTLRRYSTGADSGTFRRASLHLSYAQKEAAALPIPGYRAGAAAITPDLSQVGLQISRAMAPDIIKDNYAIFTRRNPEIGEEDDTAFFSTGYEVDLDSEMRADICADKADAQIRGGVLSYFLPSWIGVHYDVAAQKAVALADYISDPLHTTIGTRHFSDETLSARTLEVINEWIVQHGGRRLPSNAEGVSAAQAREGLFPMLRRARSFPRHYLSSLPKPDEDMLADVGRLREMLKLVMRQEGEPEYEVEPEMPRVMSAASEFFKDFLTTGVRYLGPLRDSPRPVYQLEALESTTDVGYRGEHTAAILDLNSTRRVTYHRPPDESSDTDYVTFPKPASSSLHDAVVDWLTYLGVANDVVTTDVGVFGNRLQVTTDARGHLHDLTNVGVGVSQVLPIVVMALLAPRGSFLIFEQPELHLHPRVQARLADFFLSLALDGKQTLLETHSEYLIDRFRLRIALSESDKVRPLINILFSQKSGGSTSLTPIDITQYGAITNWPIDFFDQSQRDVGRIIRAAHVRRSRRRE